MSDSTPTPVSCSTPRPPLLIAHRGASHDAPENTLAALDLAWRQEADGAEIDVQRTADDRLAVCHDPTLWQVARRRDAVASLTMADLARVDAGNWKGRRWRGEPIPELGEVLDAIPSGRQLLVEIKGAIECVPALERAVRRSRLPAAALTVIGFSREAMQVVKARLPRVRVLWVVKFTRSPALRRWRPAPSTPLLEARRAGLDGLDVSAQAPWSPAWMQSIRQARLQLFVWTVDRPALARRLAALGVDGLTTNRPGWLREKMGWGRPPRM